MRRTSVMGFTLVELLVVIALIALLMTVMVPVVLRFMSGRGLGMAGNNIAGFVAFSRTEAMNTRQTHVIAMYTEEKDISNVESSLVQKVGPGMVLFRINPNPTGNDKIVNFVKQLSFTAQLGSDIRFTDKWLRKADTKNLTGLPDAANRQFAGMYKLVLRTDGRIMVPNDIPGYVLDLKDLRKVQTDIMLTDGSRYLLIDINAATGAVRRSPALEAEEVDQQ